MPRGEQVMKMEGLFGYETVWKTRKKDKKKVLFLTGFLNFFSVKWDLSYRHLSWSLQGRGVTKGWWYECGMKHTWLLFNPDSWKLLYSSIMSLIL